MKKTNKMEKRCAFLWAVYGVEETSRAG